VTYKLKTIAISECNYAALKSLGKAGDSFNDVLSKLLLGYLDNIRGEVSSSHQEADIRKRGGEEVQ
jgi:predicted CopG family antitoxin